MNPTGHSRRTHRKRFSALRLSSDTTSTLPEYIAWQKPEPDTPSDLPPGYPDSAEEADEDTDPGSSPASPRKLQFRRRRKHLTSSSDPYLDSLLERSVHALEMSNVLLQSSISTQSTLTSALTTDNLEASGLELSARSLSSRISGNSPSWEDDLDEISRGVDCLFGDEQPAVSSSLPSTSPLKSRTQRRRPSLDLRSVSDRPHLRFEAQDRSHLVAPPPRALTQYVASSSDADAIILPSTIGLRSASSLHHPSLHSSVSSPVLTERHEPSTRAYNMLSSFVRPSSSGSPTPSSSFTSPRSPFQLSSSRERGHTRGAHRRSSPNSAEATESRRSRSRTPKAPVTPLRCMTPPLEESSSSSSDGCPAKQTVSALRKILDEQPPPPPPPSFSQVHPPPLLISPAPLAEASTSTATASVSRLFTKPTHTSSTRPPSPPRHSSLKQRSVPPSPKPPPSPTVKSIPDMIGAGVALALGGSRPGSGRSTPKRISFAQLPESYASSRPEGSSSKFQEKKSRARKRHGRSQSLTGSSSKKSAEKKSGESWWISWLVGSPGVTGPAGTGPSGFRTMDDRMDRGWGVSSRMGSFSPSGLDDWSV